LFVIAKDCNWRDSANYFIHQNMASDNAAQLGIYGLHPICKEKANLCHKEEIASIYAA